MTTPAPELFAYYFPNYHLDARNAKQHGAGWTEWELVKTARPRFSGHAQPKVPLWGCEDEADPRVMARKIDAAADFGLAGFLFDWYFYEDGPFLERALDEGFLGAANNHRLKFALMWANHDWIDIHPATTNHAPPLQFPGRVSREAWERLTDVVVERYFSHPSYWKLDGCPYFSIYELATLVSGLGVTGAVEAMDSFRAKVQGAGFPDLHLNLAAWGLSPGSFGVLPVESRVESPLSVARSLRTASVTPYVWIHHYDLSANAFPLGDYDACARANFAQWDEAHNEASAFNGEFFPNVTMGWDASPRTRQDEPFENSGYPFCPVLDASPAEFEAALRVALAWARTHKARAITLNAWNEWTEGSYLEPDTRHGYAFLEAIRRVAEGRED